MSRNLLAQETSPYLLQHQHNPVHWRPWGEAALAEAQAEDKPILLSVGYAACHWCHVMAHESFEDLRIAGLINRLFIPIKVDREERPDIDHIYQLALAMMGQQGGWPLTMFLNPSGSPFWGGTYFPPEPRYGRPGFDQILQAVAETYGREPDKVAGNVAALTAALAQQTRPQPGDLPSEEGLDEAARSLLPAVDGRRGGLTGAPKFPQPSLFQFIWRAAIRTGEAALRQAVLVTLDAMSHGGIYDHLGGGFARYATDEDWLVPHFEKMLYDNAQLIELLTLVWQDTRTPVYALRVAETIGWLQREMMAEHGAFAATLDADSEGAEGKYYVWREQEIDQALPPSLAEAFKPAYGVTPQGNWEGVNILNRNHPQPRAGEDFETELAEARAILLELRRRRVPPGRDDKILADWNGLMIAAIAQASFVFERKDWLSLAERAFAGVVGHMSPKNGRLVHSLRLGRLQPDAMLDDYAQMARAALLLFEVTGREDYLALAKQWVATADAHYWDPQGGGYFLTADDAKALIIRTKTAQDHATPAGNGVMVEVLARLFLLTGEESYRNRAERTVSTFTGDFEGSFPALSSLLNGWEFLLKATQVVIAGSADDPNRQALLRKLAEICLPNRLMQILDPSQNLPPGHPAADKLALAARTGTLAFVCRGSACLPPVTDPESLGRLLTIS